MKRWFFCRTSGILLGMAKHARGVFFFVAAFGLIASLLPAAAGAQDGPRYRALLIACDEFVEAAPMTPIGENNLRIMEQMLAQDVRGFEVKRQYGITSSKESLAYAIGWAFDGAREGDVSLLYISTHGDFITTHNNPYGTLLLSDGSLQDSVTAQALNEMLDRVPGTKVLLVDACNSGALMAKGVSPDVGAARVARTFQSDGYKALTSSGASEPSWYLQPTLEHAPAGSSYFTTAMAVGAGLIGGYAADANRDGVITLREMYAHLWVAQASSAVQMFPQDDDFPLIVYDKGKLTEESRGELDGFVFGSLSLDARDPVLEFSYTATAPTRVAYRVTYWRGGQWDWARGETLLEGAGGQDDSRAAEEVTPGRKQVSLRLSSILPEGWTYAMIHIMTLGDTSEGGQPFIYASRVLSARDMDRDPDMAVRAPLVWNRRAMRRMEIFVRHAVPCRLTVSIRDEQGRLVRRLATSQATRPQSLTPDGSLLYWNGLCSDGTAALPGKYTVHASARVAGAEYEAQQSVSLQ